MGQTEDARVAAEVARRMQRGETRRAGPQGPFEPKPEAEVEAEVRAEFAERDQLAAAGRRGARRAGRSTTTRDSVAGHGEESALAERYAAQEAEKKTAGRYTLEEAAKLAAGSDERVRPALLARFIEAARSHALPTYLPGTDFRLRYGRGAGETAVVREFYEQARWDELNAWLAANEPRGKFRFQCPTGDNADKRYAAPHVEPNRPIALPASTQRVLIADALAQLRSARGEAVVDFYENAGGEVVVRLKGGHVLPPDELKSDFVAYLGAAGVRPTSPAGRWSATYSGTVQDDNIFEITVAEFERFALSYDVPVIQLGETADATGATEVKKKRGRTGGMAKQDWHEKARRYAEEAKKAAKKEVPPRNCGLRGQAIAVAGRFEKEGITGVHGEPLRASTILRDALQGHTATTPGERALKSRRKP